MTVELRYVREWAEKQRAALAARDRWIVAASSAGSSLREIAVAAGLTHAGVRKIIDRTPH